MCMKVRPVFGRKIRGCNGNIGLSWCPYYKNWAEVAGCGFENMKQEKKNGNNHIYMCRYVIKRPDFYIHVSLHVSLQLAESCGTED